MDIPPRPQGELGLRGAGGAEGWGWQGAWRALASVVGTWCSLSCLCLLYFSCFSSPPLPALLLPRVWPWAVPTYGPYGRFCSWSARLSCMSVLVIVTSMPLSLAPLCPCLLHHSTPGDSAQSTCRQGPPSVELACFCPGLSFGIGPAWFWGTALVSGKPGAFSMSRSRGREGGKSRGD